MGCLIHKWDGCICVKCGRKRDSHHDYVWIPARRTVDKYRLKEINGCYQSCRKCRREKTGSFSEHQYKKEEGKCWEAVCIRCGEKLNNIHHKYRYEYNPKDGSCLRKCTQCGEEAGVHHQLAAKSQDGRCVQVCTRCGHSWNAHSWEKIRYGSDGSGQCRCIICGEINPNGIHKWSYITEGNYTGIKVCKICGTRDESEKITLEQDKENQEKYQEAMELADSLGEMRGKGIHC